MANSGGAKKARVRRGRGNASGGNYSGRGMKGQRARTGGRSGLKFRGVKAYLLRIPKARGFKSGEEKNIPINLGTLNKCFNDGEMVSLKSLVRLGLIIRGQKNVKILAKGELTKKLQVKIDNLSARAKEAILAAGGNIIETKQAAEPADVEKSQK